MRIKDIMVPWNGKKRIKDGINKNCCIYSVNVAHALWDNSAYEVIDDADNKVGEIDRDLFRYLINSTNTNIISNIVDKFQEGVIAIDAEGRIFYINDAYTKILGVPISKIIGKQMRKVEPGAEILNVLRTKIPIIKDKQYIKTLDKYVSVHIYPIEQDGELKAVVSIFTDATEIVKLGRKVEEANKAVLRFKEQIEAQNKLLKLEIIGESSNFLKTVSQALIVAKTEASVLIEGENGTGKELIAKLIHSNSERKSQPMIIVNCAAVPESLIESELFGYEEGSFTGAKSGGKMGKFELANGGTLFLDEIGDMPMAMQAKLLRVLQEGEIEKIGRQKNVPVNVRLIAATNQPLERMVREKKFRRDLYYRLNIVEIKVPPLRERGEDVGLLANHFLQKYNKKYGKQVFFSQRVHSFFYSYSWPGNVREMCNCIEYAVIMCLDDCFDVVYLPPHIKESIGEITEERNRSEYTHGTLKEAVKSFEKKMITDVLSESNGNRSKAMRLLGLSRRTFYRKLKEYKIVSV
ncbi:sigma 54-interacting transcriptional regulator [Clostridium sp. WLY-B-L2]|uniref:Sigma 54-interacting transcriptional regulator n=1 Tax=Clostridium aromativorans TaxID=2836848 RepID=A0ABS8N1Y7_9CLOT|nr:MULTISPECIES: sigma 54-interacting transcriptional regulator [Clostridium]KAA8674776.1 PAS domain S-box protein [Clostridium sp. HV4-5-A1G]MCC9293815.1 sigma 54-interacting transcriptional regulator [Clostridium aromativorans]